MSKELRDKLIYAGLGLALGLVTSYAAMWRDLAVIKVQQEHMIQDIAHVRSFITSPDPRVFREAQRALKDDDRHEGALKP